MGRGPLLSSHLWNCPLIAVYLETYGCQMNVNDTEISSGSILQKSGYLRTSNLQEVYTFPLFPVSWGWVRFAFVLVLRWSFRTGCGLVRTESWREVRNMGSRCTLLQLFQNFIGAHLQARN